MTVSLTHAFVSGKTDGGDATLVQPSNWNAGHTISMDTARLLGRTTASAGAVEELQVFPAEALASGRLEAGYYPDPSRCMLIFTDFFTSNAEGRFAAGHVGGGASIGGNIGSGGVPGLGVVVLTTGATATGRGALLWPTNGPSSNQNIRFGVDQWEFDVSLVVPTLSDGTNTFAFRIGFAEDSAVIAQVDQVVFECGGALGNNNWWCTNRAAGSATQTDSGVAVSTTTYQRLRAVVDATAANVLFYIDGTLVATHTTNIPSGTARLTGFGMSILKSLGTTARTALIDWLLLRCIFTSGRPTT